MTAAEPDDWRTGNPDVDEWTAAQHARGRHSNNCPPDCAGDQTSEPDDSTDQDRQAGDDETDRPRLVIRDIGQVRADIATRGPRRWLVSGMIPADAYGVHGGAAKAQKTWNALDLAVSVASGTHWLEHYPIDTMGPVLIFAGEGGDASILRRIDAIATAKDIDADPLPIHICTRVPHLGDPGHLAEVRAALADQRPALVVLDPFYLAARGAKLGNLYEMGGMLESVQHLCQDAGAALLVVHHFNRNRDAGGLDRFSGAGPAEWGRFLIGARVVHSWTDPDTSESFVTTELDLIGGEVPDQTAQLRRRIRSETPADLESPMAYHVEVIEVADEQPAGVPSMPNATPSTQRVYAALQEAEGPLTVKAIGDQLASTGRPLRKRTIQEALNKLGDQVDRVVVDSRGTTEWLLTKEAA